MHVAGHGELPFEAAVLFKYTAPMASEELIKRVRVVVLLRIHLSLLPYTAWGCSEAVCSV